MRETYTEEDLRSALMRLALVIRAQVEQQLSKGVLQPEEQVYRRWRIDDFENPRDGPGVMKAHDEFMTRRTWDTASLQVEKSVSATDEYVYSLGLLTQCTPSNKRTELMLSSFVRKLVSSHLSNPSVSEDRITSFIAYFLKDVHEEPLGFTVRADLDGISIAPEVLDFEVGGTHILLRQATISDFEKEFLHLGLVTHLLPRSFPTVLEMKFLAREPAEAQQKLDQAVTILRLFKVASVKYLTYTLDSQSITSVDLSRSSFGEQQGHVLERNQITDEDAPRLRRFWQTMEQVLPTAFYNWGSARPDHTVVSYMRYCDAVLQNGSVERRIANAVMGLESLFLERGKTQELRYRLGIRVAKLHGMLGFGSRELRRAISDAYRVRSVFVHGGHLTRKEGDKLSGRYGSVGALLGTILDCVRISIVNMALVRIEKEKLLDLIDSSLVDKSSESRLEHLLDPVKPLLRNAGDR